MNITGYGNREPVDNVISAYDDCFYGIYNDPELRNKPELRFPVLFNITKCYINYELQYKVLIIFNTLKWHTKPLKNRVLREQYKKFFLKEIIWETCVVVLKRRQFCYYISELEFYDINGKRL